MFQRNLWNGTSFGRFQRPERLGILASQHPWYSLLTHHAFPGSLLKAVLWIMRDMERLDIGLTTPHVGPVKVLKYVDVQGSVRLMCWTLRDYQNSILKLSGEEKRKPGEGIIGQLYSQIHLTTSERQIYEISGGSAESSR